MLCSFGGELRSQDFSDAIRAGANACLQATMAGDYEKLVTYTHPAVMELLDNVAGGKGKGIDFIKEQMKSLTDEGVRFDSGSVGDPTPHVVAGEELMAVIPTVLYMSVEEMHLRQESYMIAISGDSGKSWTFVNGSDNIEMMIAMLFPNWNDALELPEKKSPEIIGLDDEEPEVEMEGGEGAE